MQFQARKKDDGKGPYRWRPLVRTVDGLALGGQYDVADDLSPNESDGLQNRLGEHYELREVDA